MDENEVYHNDTSRIGKSGLDLIAQAPAKYYAKYLDPNREREKKTPALITGSAMHTLILEPYKFSSEFAVMPEFSGEGMKKRKEAWEQNNVGKQPISMETYNQVSRMRDAAMSHPLVPELLSVGVVEQRMDWEDPATGALCKGKPDFRNTSSGLIIDLKSTEDASENGFTKSAYSFRYHVQAPFYTDGARLNGFNPTGFVFVAIEKEPPYLVNVYFADEQFMAHGRMVYQQDLETYMECVMTGKWPGYSPEIKPLSLPTWVANKL